MTFVIDASVAIKWYIPEIYELEAEKLFSRRAEFHVPELIIPEFSNIIWKKMSRGFITKEEGTEIISSFSLNRWTLHSHRSLTKSAFIGAAETGLTVYDWTYLALAISLNGQFITADEKFFNKLKETSFNSHLLWIGNVSDF